MIKAAVVGLGKMGLSHHSIINTHPDVELAAVCDASGAIPPREAIEWVCAQPNIESIVFGASGKENIRNTRELVSEYCSVATK